MGLPLPKHFLIQNILRERFRECRRGDCLPSESTLTREFKVSRVTVRRALAGLVDEGLIARQQGRGTFYVGGNRAAGLQRLSGLLEGLIEYEGGARARVIDKAKSSQPSLDVRERLRLDPDDPVVIIKRVATVEGEPLVYIVSHLPYDIGIKVYDAEQDLERYPLVYLLREKYGVPLARAIQTIEAALADAEVAERLGVAFGAPVLRVERIYFAKGGRPVHFTRSYYRGDRYRYSVTLRGWKEPRVSRRGEKSSRSRKRG